MMHHRFVERPDIALMVFLAFTIYALNAWIRAGRRWIFWLPVVQLLWANTHPSIIVGLDCPSSRCWAVASRCRWARGSSRAGGGIPAETSIPRGDGSGVVAAVLAGVLAASALNPYRFDALTLPFTLADQPWFRQEILELQPPRPGGVAGALRC